MIERIEEFCELLRRNGVRVSTGEVVDAVRAVDVVGVEDVGRVRATLRGVLVKRAADVPTFDELFGLYFLGGAELARSAASGSAAELAGEVASSFADPDALAAALATEAAALGPVARAGLGVGAPRIASMVAAAGADIGLPRMSTPLQIGFFTHRVLDALDVTGAESAALDALERLQERGLIDAPGLAGLVDRARAGFEQLRRAVRDHVEREFRRRNLDYRRRLANASLAEKPLARLTDREMVELRHEVTRLARVLRARASVRQKVKRRGRLDLRATLRRSLATGGVPFELRRRRRQRRKPRLVILCDISDSVRNVSRFMLQFVHALQDVFDRVQSLAFVAELGELTELFERHDLDRALELAYGGSVVNVFANSNYGRALEQFAERHLDKVTPRTTVLVIGDGRNNYHPSNAGILADLRLRARQVWWLNPEAPSSWGLGDSAMHEYRPFCDRVVVARDLESLRNVVDRLVID